MFPIYSPENMGTLARNELNTPHHNDSPDFLHFLMFMQANYENDPF